MSKSQKHIESLVVMFNDQKVGTLNLGDRQKIFFAYDQEWLKHGFNISPFDLKMTIDWQLPSKPDLFDGLHGVFADSISDGWGLLLTDRAIQNKFGWTRQSITPLDRLYFMGHRTMGGLRYVPYQKEKNAEEDFSFEEIFQETQKVISGETQEVLQSLYLSGGSPGGARPKAVFAKKGHQLRAGYDDIPEGYEAWMVKFFGGMDSHYMGKIEMIYSDMARDCGIVMPRTELVSVTINGKQQDFFAIERFDREGPRRFHTCSLSGLVYASHRVPSVGYKDILNVTSHLTKNQKEVERIADVMLFNVILSNQDDHAKNWTFKYNQDHWEVSPGYDLVYSQGLGNEHMSDVLGQGKPGYDALKTIMKNFMIKNADEKIEKTLQVSESFSKYADKYELDGAERKEIEKTLKGIRERFEKDMKSKQKPKTK